MLSMYVDECHEDWDEYLGFVTFAYNTGRQESTGYSPLTLVYGREPVLPTDLVAATGPGQLQLAEPKGLMKAMSSLRDDVKDRLAFAQVRQKEQYDGRSDDAPVFEKDDLVLIFRPRRKKGLAEKLLHNWVGPCKVVKRLTDLN